MQPRSAAIDQRPPRRVLPNSRPIAIDGAHGEGGGQLVRTAVALSAITGRTLVIENIRAGRTRPGLAPQHAAAVTAVGALCNAQISGLALRSRALTFAPGELHGGNFRFDIGTAGSITLLLQALLPALVASGEPANVVVRGGTDVRAAPPLDYFREVTLPLLARIGIRAELAVLRRGYFPRGGGEVTLRCIPSRIHPTGFHDPGKLRRVNGVAHVAGIDLDIAHRMRDAFLAGFGASTQVPTEMEIVSLPPAQAIGAGGAIVAWAETENALLGAGRVAERGVRAETLGDAVALELRSDLDATVGLDVHAADQIPVYLALAGGGSFSTRELASHARTAIWLIEQFLPVRFECVPGGSRVRVRVTPGTASVQHRHD